MTTQTRIVEKRGPFLLLALGLCTLILDGTPTCDDRILQSFRHPRRTKCLLQFCQIEAQLFASRASPAEQVVESATFIGRGLSVGNGAGQGTASRHSLRKSIENPTESRLFKESANPRGIRRRFHRRCAEVCVRSRPTA